MDFDEISVEDVDYSEAMEILGGDMEAEQGVVEKLKSMRKSYIDELEGRELAKIVSECNSWDGSLGDYRMDENSNETLMMMFGDDLVKLAFAIYNGDYSPYHDCVRMDAYGWLVSMNEYEYHKHLEDNRDEIYDMYEILLSEQPEHISDAFTWM